MMDEIEKWSVIGEEEITESTCMICLRKKFVDEVFSHNSIYLSSPTCFCFRSSTHPHVRRQKAILFGVGGRDHFVFVLFFVLFF